MSIGFGGMQSVLQEKYRILAQEADAKSISAAAHANLLNAQAGVEGPMARARMGAMTAQSRLGQDQFDLDRRRLPGEIEGQRIKNMGGMLTNSLLAERLNWGMDPTSGDLTALTEAPAEPVAAPAPRYAGPLQIGTGFDAPKPRTSLGMPKKPTVNVGDVPLGWPSLALTQSSVPKATFGSLTPMGQAPSSSRDDFYKSQGIGMQPKKPSGSALYDRYGM